MQTVIPTKINPLECHLDLVNLFERQLMVIKTKVQGVEKLWLAQGIKKLFL
jgi:hypothetical protein